MTAPGDRMAEGDTGGEAEARTRAVARQQRQQKGPTEGTAAVLRLPKGEELKDGKGEQQQQGSASVVSTIRPLLRTPTFWLCIGGWTNMGAGGHLDPSMTLMSPASAPGCPGNSCLIGILSTL